MTSLNRLFSNFASRTARVTGSAPAFAGCVVLIAAWAATGPAFGFSQTWQLVINTGTTIVTFLMVFLIQNAQNRDAAAIQAKLDELIRALDHGRTEFIGIEHLGERELIEIRDRLERECPSATKAWAGCSSVATDSHSLRALCRPRSLLAAQGPAGAVSGGPDVEESVRFEQPAAQDDAPAPYVAEFWREG